LDPDRVIRADTDISDHDFPGFSAGKMEEIWAVGQRGVFAHGRLMLNWKISVGNAEMQCINVSMKDKLSWAKTAAAIAALLAAGTDEVCAGDFIRVKETDPFAKLQTAVFEYEKDGVRVDLIGAIHLADRRYYEFLNKYFKNYEVLLFEMVGGERLGGERLGGERLGGERLGGARENVEEEPGKADLMEVPEADNLEGLRKLYVSMEKALGLVGQSAVIDYMAENFVHADLTMEEFEAKQKERGESLMGFAFQASMLAEKPSKEPNSLRLLQGLLGGRPDLVKLELMQTMEQGDKQIDALAGENVIISDRNARCMEVLSKELASGRKKVGVFYGAAHFPDMERRLEKLGFKKVSSKWLTAWSVRKAN